MTKTLIKEALRSITANKLRFLSVAVIIALGMSFFVGINSASPAMNYEANEYFNRNNLMDVYVSSSIPFTNEDIEKIKKYKKCNSGCRIKLYRRLCDARQGDPCQQKRYGAYSENQLI